MKALPRENKFRARETSSILPNSCPCSNPMMRGYGEPPQCLPQGLKMFFGRFRTSGIILNHGWFFSSGCYKGKLSNIPARTPLVNFPEFTPRWAINGLNNWLTPWTPRRSQPTAVFPQASLPKLDLWGLQYNQVINRPNKCCLRNLGSVQYQSWWGVDSPCFKLLRILFHCHCSPSQATFFPWGFG